MKLEIVKFVITFKMDEAKEKKLIAEKLSLKKRIADEIAKKKDNKISEMSIEELEKVYNEL